MKYWVIFIFCDVKYELKLRLIFKFRSMNFIFLNFVVVKYFGNILIVFVLESVVVSWERLVWFGFEIEGFDVCICGLLAKVVLWLIYFLVFFGDF